MKTAIYIQNNKKHSTYIRYTRDTQNPTEIITATCPDHQCKPYTAQANPDMRTPKATQKDWNSTYNNDGLLLHFELFVLELRLFRLCVQHGLVLVLGVYWRRHAGDQGMLKSVCLFVCFGRPPSLAASLLSHWSTRRWPILEYRWPCSQNWVRW